MAEETLDDPALSADPPAAPDPPKEGERAVTTPAPTGEQAAMAALIATARQLPGLVPELITGSTPAEVAASTELARATYARIVAQVNKEAQEGIPATGGTAGAAPAPTPGIGEIAAGIEQRAARQRK